MPKVAWLTNSLWIAVYPDDHAPPHCHLGGPDTDAVVDLGTLNIIEGECRKGDWKLAREWLAVPENLARVREEWERQNER